MKALIVYSLQTLCDLSSLERNACNRACQRHGIPAILTARDHASIVKTTTMLDMLAHLPGPVSKRHALIDSYLSLLNESIWNAGLRGSLALRDVLLNQTSAAQRIGLVSDYPLSTTSLVRSSVFGGVACPFDKVIAPAEGNRLPPISAGLSAAMAALGAEPEEVEVLSAHQRGLRAARALGASAYLVEARHPGPFRTVQKPAFGPGPSGHPGITHLPKQEAAEAAI